MFGKLGFNLMDLKTVGEDALDALLRGVSGEQFAVSLCSGRRNGERLYDALCELGRDQIMGLLAMAPGGVPAQLAGREAEISAWLDAFIAAGEEEEEAPGGGKAA